MQQAFPFQTQEQFCLSLGVLVIIDSTSCNLLHKILFSLSFPSLASCFLPLLQCVHWDVFVICLFQLSMKAQPSSVLYSLLHYSPSISRKPYLEPHALLHPPLQFLWTILPARLMGKAFILHSSAPTLELCSLCCLKSWQILPHPFRELVQK